MRTPASRNLFAALAGALLLVTAFAVVGPATATHQPANKMSVSGSAVEVMSTGFSPLATTSEVVTLLTGKIKTSAPTDLIFRATMECALWTDITTVGNDESQAIATVKAWVEIDGVPVRVSSDDTGAEAGKVVFCNRDYKRVTSMWDDENATIEDYLRTRTANAFNWILVNAGSGTHIIELKGSLETEVNGTGNAKAAVGKRTLIVEPEKLANDVSL